MYCLNIVLYYIIAEGGIQNVQTNDLLFKMNGNVQILRSFVLCIQSQWKRRSVKCVFEWFPCCTTNTSKIGWNNFRKSNCNIVAHFILTEDDDMIFIHSLALRLLMNELRDFYFGNQTITSLHWCRIPSKIHWFMGVI